MSTKKTPTEPVTKESKPGYKTTEFWITLAVTAATILNQSGILGKVVIPIEAVATVATLAVAYIFSRTVAKK